MNPSLDELNLKIILLEEEMAFLREQLLELKRGETSAYQQLITKYNETICQVEPEKERTIIYEDKEYIVDKNNFLWDENGYVFGWLNENNEVMSNKE